MGLTPNDRFETEVDLVSLTHVVDVLVFIFPHAVLQLSPNANEAHVHFETYLLGFADEVG